MGKITNQRFITKLKDITDNRNEEHTKGTLKIIINRYKSFIDLVKAISYQER